MKMTFTRLKLIILCAFATFSINTNAQIPIFEWASNQQFVGNFHETAITVDSSENVYFTGYYSGNHDFDPGPADSIEIPQGNDDAFLVKLDPSGNLLWYHTFGTFGVDQGFSVFTDSSENVYVSGRYGNTIDFDPGLGVYNLTPITGETFGFLASYTPNGDFRWAHTLPGYLYVPDGAETSYTPDGHILISDRFVNTLDFDPGPGTFNMTSSSSSDMYVLKLDLDGNFIWARQFEGTYQSARSIKGHSSGNIFVTGYYSGIVDLDPGPGIQSETAIGFWDGFVIKLNSSGDLVFGKTFGGADRDEPKEIDIDDQQNIYVSGLFKNTADFDPGPGVQNFTSEGERDPYLLKLDANGNFVWFHNYGGFIEDRKIAVDLDPLGNIYATGWFYDTLDFEPGAGVSNQITDLTGTNIFITKLTSLGGLEWVKSIDGTWINVGTGIYCAPSGNFYVCGEYDEIVDFNPGFGNAIYSSTGGRDGFNLKYSQCYQSNPVPDVATLTDFTASCSVDSLVAPTANENCTGGVVGIPDVTFPITSVGTTVVTWTFDAGNGFITTQTQNVIIQDLQAPSPDLNTLPNIDAVCSVNSLTPPSATDDCEGTILGTHNSSLPITATSVVTWTYDDGNGNTSTQTQNVNISPIDNTVTLTGGVNLEAVASGYSYQWLDCDNNNAPIVGETSQNYTATVNGNYAAEISNATCSVISNCIEILEVGLAEHNLEQVISIYPNPTTGKTNIKLNKEYDQVAVEIKDAAGRSLNSFVVTSVDFIDVDLEGANGIYFIEVHISENGSKHFRVVKH